MAHRVFSDIKAQMDAAQAEVKRIEAELRAKGKDMIAPVFQEYLASHPEVEAIRFEAYIPYFNDGDELVFRVREICVEFTHEFRTQHLDPKYDADGMDDAKWCEGDTYYMNKSHSEVKVALKAFNKFVSEIKNEELFRAVFGDHARVEATRAGLSVEEYTDHD